MTTMIAFVSLLTCAFSHAPQARAQTRPYYNEEHKAWIIAYPDDVRQGYVVSTKWYWGYAEDYNFQEFDPQPLGIKENGNRLTLDCPEDHHLTFSIGSKHPSKKWRDQAAKAPAAGGWEQYYKGLRGDDNNPEYLGVFRWSGQGPAPNGHAYRGDFVVARAKGRTTDGVTRIQTIDGNTTVHAFDTSYVKNPKITADGLNLAYYDSGLQRYRYITIFHEKGTFGKVKVFEGDVDPNQPGQIINMKPADYKALDSRLAFEAGRYDPINNAFGKRKVQHNPCDVFTSGKEP
ncbi:MAG: hypothetical protein HY921_05205 [Elusimicrobia bacterium]|nr:hypothetical protein [Elusimicrobiota bacterium]